MLLEIVEITFWFMFFGTILLALETMPKFDLCNLSSNFQTTSLEACAQIRERLSEIKGLGHPNQYGLFLMDEDPKKGVWLEPGRTLEHYLLRDNVSLHKIYDLSKRWKLFLCWSKDGLVFQKEVHKFHD